MIETQVAFICPTSGIQKEYLYQHSEKHRNGQIEKSQWTIPIVEEANTFRNTCEENWVNGSCGWGIYIVNGKVAYLGRDRAAGDVFLAKFDNHAPWQWHGYPCDYRIDNQRPTTDVLMSWVCQGYLGIAKIRKITKGQRCAI